MAADNRANDHWLVVEILSRYAEAVRSGQEAERMYPAIPRHLAGCEACRRTLGYLLSPPEARAGLPRITPPLPEGGGGLLPSEPAALRWAWRPGSDASSFGLRLSFRVCHRLPGREPAVPRLPFSGDAWLAFRWPGATEGALRVRLSVEGDGPGRVAIVGQLLASELPVELWAYLFAGQEVYGSAVRGGALRFEGVVLGADLERVGLVIEVPSSQARGGDAG